jgi:hypothetical protein
VHTAIISERPSTYGLLSSGCQKSEVALVEPPQKVVQACAGVSVSAFAQDYKYKPRVGDEVKASKLLLAKYRFFSRLG